MEELEDNMINEKVNGLFLNICIYIEIFVFYREIFFI